jgi:hypothetical protein
VPELEAFQADEPVRPAAPSVILDDELPLLIPLSDDPAPLRWVWRGPALGEVQPEHLAPQIPFRPLLAPRSADTVLRTVVSRRVRAGPVDTDALVQLMAQQRPVRALPLERVTTLSFGAQVLVDLGQGMEPFIADRRALLRQLSIVVGRDGLSVRYFRYAPLRGVSDTGHGRRQAYQPPPPGTRVLILSDLGLSGPVGDTRRAPRAEWESFAQVINRNGCQAAALVPIHPSRWPGWLVRLFPLVSWDRHTTAGEAARRMGRR